LDEYRKAFEPTYKYGEILTGSDTLSPLGPLEKLVDDMMFSKTERNGMAYNKTLKMLRTLYTVGDNDGKRPYIQLFGDYGYANPGYGGIGAFDVFEVTSPITLIRASGEIYKMTNEGNTIWARNSTGTTNWWARFEDTINLTLVEVQDDVTATCYDYKQVIKCDFIPPTRILIGVGNWQSTARTFNESGSLVLNSPGSGCTQTIKAGTFKDPQAPKLSTLQYVVPMDVSETDKANNIGSSPVNATLGSCMACPINVNNITASFDDPDCRTDVLWPDDTSAPVNLLSGSNFCVSNPDFECYKEGFPQCCLAQECDPRV
jgi:hypothetical protein